MSLPDQTQSPFFGNCEVCLIFIAKLVCKKSLLFLKLLKFAFFGGVEDWYEENRSLQWTFGWDKSQSLSESGAIPPLPLRLGILPPFSVFRLIKSDKTLLVGKRRWVGSHGGGFSRSSKYFPHEGLLKFRRL